MQPARPTITPDAQPLNLTATQPGQVQNWTWIWEGQSIQICYETWGSGTPILVLPALSTVSSRHEMQAMVLKLLSLQLLNPVGDQHQIITLDWPGFGDSDRPRLNYQPALYCQFLRDFITTHFTQPAMGIAAGHAAGYTLSVPDLWTKLVLIAPTWRGPLAVMGASAGLRRGIRELVRSPLLGSALYGLNTYPAMLRWMYRRHVFVDAAQLTPAFITQHRKTTQKPGARYAPAAFVTGGLDPVSTRFEFLDLVAGFTQPLLAILADHAPPSSKAEMEAIATLPQIQTLRLSGTLGMAEEYGNEIATAIAPFLAHSF